MYRPKDFDNFLKRLMIATKSQDLENLAFELRVGKTVLSEHLQLKEMPLDWLVTLAESNEISMDWILFARVPRQIYLEETPAVYNKKATHDEQKDLKTLKNTIEAQKEQIATLKEINALLREALETRHAHMVQDAQWLQEKVAKYGIDSKKDDARKDP